MKNQDIEIDQLLSSQNESLKKLHVIVKEVLELLNHLHTKIDALSK